MSSSSSRHFLQTPGPTNIPGRARSATGEPIIDHRGPEFAARHFASLWRDAAADLGLRVRTIEGDWLSDADPTRAEQELAADADRASGHDADRLREIALDQFDMSLGAGLSILAPSVFRIGYLGAFNDLSLFGALSGVEAAPGSAGVSHRPGGVTAAIAESTGGVAHVC